MLENKHKGQAALWVLVVIAVVALIVLWMSKKPISLTTTNNQPEEVITISPTVTPTPSMNLDEIGTGLKELNTSASDIDKGLNDSQINVLE